MKRTAIVTCSTFVITLSLVLFTNTGAMAQGKNACAGDVEKFCQGVQQGEGRIAQCLAQHKEELSPACKVRLEQAAKQLKGVQKACEDDIMTYCEGVQPGGGRIAQCLKANAAKLSPQCKSSLAQAKRGMR